MTLHFASQGGGTITLELPENFIVGKTKQAATVSVMENFMSLLMTALVLPDDPGLKLLDSLEGALHQLRVAQIGQMAQMQLAREIHLAWGK